MKFKKTIKGETGQARKYCKWPWSSQMLFLDATLQFRPQSSNITQATRREIEDKSLPSEATFPLANNNDETNQFHSPPEMLPPPLPKKKGKSQ